MQGARNPETFLPIAEYPYRDRVTASQRGGDFAELTVLGGVPDIADVIRVAGDC